jgi:hypothetical protein
VEKELRTGWQMREAQAFHQAKQIAAHGHANEARSVEGIGRLKARIPPDAYHYWGVRLGYECWQDKQFLKEFLRDNPEVAVRNYAKKTVVQGAIFTSDGFITK